MTQTEIQSWLDYWRRAKMVAIDKINAFDQVYQARKYCSCMRVSVFSDVTDLQIWRAIVDMRARPEQVRREINALACPRHGSLEFHDGSCFICDAAGEECGA